MKTIKVLDSALIPLLWRNSNVARVYLYLLSKSGEPVSYRGIAKDTGLTMSMVKTALEKLKSNGVITQVSTQVTTQVSTQITLCGIEVKSKSATQKTTQIITQVPTQVKTKVFRPPTEQEVCDYVAEKGFHFNPESFIPFYQGKGWKVGDQPMKDWKAACRTWEIRWKEKHGEQFYYQISQRSVPRKTNRLEQLEQANRAILQQPGNIDSLIYDKK